ncbi:hypothetical protein IWX47DRAFT_299861 [Phyllosticta citricarpa]
MTIFEVSLLLLQTSFLETWQRAEFMWCVRYFGCTSVGLGMSQEVLPWTPLAKHLFNPVVLSGLALRVRPWIDSSVCGRCALNHKNPFCPRPPSLGPHSPAPFRGGSLQQISSPSPRPKFAAENIPHLMPREIRRPATMCKPGSCGTKDISQEKTVQQLKPCLYGLGTKDATSRANYFTGAAGRRGGPGPSR